MARRRYQRGQLILRGKRNKVWIARLREDVIRPDGTVVRVRSSKYVGTKKEYPTRRLAERELENILQQAAVNSLHYKPRPTATFAEFTARWQKEALSNLKRSTASADRSRIRRHLLPELGKVLIKDLDTLCIQTLITKKRATLSAKSVRNLVLTLRSMMAKAKAWGYLTTTVDPFDELVLPEKDPPVERFFSADEMQQIIEAAPEPYRTCYWIFAETGVRSGELAGLPIGNLLLEACAIRITQSVWHGKIQTPKTKKSERVCEISPQLAEHLREHLRTWRPNRAGLLFTSKRGTPWDMDLVRRRRLYPLLQKLGIERGGFHAFRHGNISLMDQQQVPWAVRTSRVGHVDSSTTMQYTHIISEDGKRFAARLGSLLVPRGQKAFLFSGKTGTA